MGEPSEPRGSHPKWAPPGTAGSSRYFRRENCKVIKVRRMEGKGTIAPEKLDLIIQRIVEVAKPEKIILFGSAARGSMGPNSDVDLLVVKSGANRLDLMGEIYRNLHGVGEPVDVIVATPDD